MKVVNFADILLAVQFSGTILLNILYSGLLASLPF